MKKLILKCSFGAFVLFYIASGASAQGHGKNVQNRKANATSHEASTAALAGRVPVVIIGTAAKMTWVTTKFTAQHFAAPVAKTILLKAAPTMTKFALRNVVRYGVPFAAKLSVL